MIYEGLKKAHTRINMCLPPIIVNDLHREGSNHCLEEVLFCSLKNDIKQKAFLTNRIIICIEKCGFETMLLVVREAKLCCYVGKVLS